jgi:DNA-binding XRE family transcriptional regulator
MTAPKSRQGKQKPIGVREASRMTYAPKGVASALEARRKTLGLTRADLGRDLGVAPETIANWEKGKAPIAACRIFSWLLGDAEFEDQWRVRALLAEATIRDIQNAMGEYRDSQR